MRRDSRKKTSKRIAKERVDILFSLAETMVKNEEYDLSSRYVELILKILKKYNIRLSRERKMKICKSCHTFLIPGKTAQVRLKKGRVVVKCKVCGSYKRYPFH